MMKRGLLGIVTFSGLAYFGAGCTHYPLDRNARAAEPLPPEIRLEQGKYYRKQFIHEESREEIARKSKY